LFLLENSRKLFGKMRVMPLLLFKTKDCRFLFGIFDFQTVRFAACRQGAGAHSADTGARIIGGTAEMVDRRWAQYGLADLELGEVDPNLFGYDMTV